jgi:hypothetical protein
MSDDPQNGFQVYKQHLENLKHHKRNSGRHSVEDYTDAEDLLDGENE